MCVCGCMHAHVHEALLPPDLRPSSSGSGSLNNCPCVGNVANNARVTCFTHCTVAQWLGAHARTETVVCTLTTCAAVSDSLATPARHQNAVRHGRPCTQGRVWPLVVALLSSGSCSAQQGASLGTRNLIDNHGSSDSVWVPAVYQNWKDLLESRPELMNNGCFQAKLEWHFMVAM